MAQTVAKAADLYTSIETSPTGNLRKLRVEAMKKLGWAKGVY
jgi:hypothetical protein